MDIEGVRNRVAGSTGTDRDLDRDIHLALGLDLNRIVHWGADKNAYTTSPDAALALLEEVTPGVFYVIAKGRTRSTEPLYGVRLMFGTDEVIAEAEHDDLCRCILSAILARCTLSHAASN